MNVLVTGAAGYIGSSLVKRLSENAKVYAFDNLFYNQGTLVAGSFVKDNVTFYNEDVNDWSSNFLGLYESISNFRKSCPFSPPCLKDVGKT